MCLLGCPFNMSGQLGLIVCDQLPSESWGLAFEFIHSLFLLPVYAGRKMFN